VRQLLILSLLVLAAAACVRAVTTPRPTIDELGCAVPPPTVFQRVGTTAELAKATIGKTDIAGAKVAVTPDVISLVSQAALDEQLAAYYHCRALKALSPDDAQWLMELTAFAKTRPSAEQMASWQREHPAPSSVRQRSAERRDSLASANAARIQAAGSIGGQPGSSSSEAEPRGSFVGKRFQGGPLSLAVESVVVSGGFVLLSLAAESGSGSMEAVLCTSGVLTDNQGGEWQLNQSAGLARVGSFNITYSSANGVAYPIEAHTTFRPGVPQTATLRFARTGSPSPSISQVTLHMECFRRRGNRDEPFSVTSPLLVVRSP
jgi:hypothetical protein